MSDQLDLSQSLPDQTGANGGGDDFANSFLEGVSEEHREIVGQYVPDWMKRVTGRFQESAEKLKIYEGFGDPQQLAEIANLQRDIQQDPVGFYNWYRGWLMENEGMLQEQYGIEDLAKELGMTDTNGGAPDPGQVNPLPEYEGIPEQFVQKVTGLEGKLDQLLSSFETSQAQQQEIEHNKMLDNLLSEMHTEHGSFNDEFVLAQIVAGNSPEEAIGAWNALKEEIVNGQNTPPPPPRLPRGPAGTPIDQVDKSKFKDASFRKEWGAKLLEQAAQQNQ